MRSCISMIAPEGCLKSIFGDWQSTHNRGCQALQPFSSVDRPRINFGCLDLAVQIWLFGDPLRLMDL